MKFNLRKITAFFPKKKRKTMIRQVAFHLRNFFLVFFIVLVGVLIQLLVILNSEYKKAATDYAVKLNEYHYWSRIAVKYPNIPDVLYNAAISSLKAGKKDVSLQYIRMALQIDPLFTRAQMLKDEIAKM